MSSSAAMDVPFDEPLQTLLAHGTAVNVMTLVGFTALLYDHFVTLTDEVLLIWRARKGVVSTIFLVNRYVIPIILALDIYESFGNAAASIMFCKVWTVVQGYLTIASYISIHAIVAWRVYAIYNGQRWVCRLLWIGGFLYFAISAGITTASLIPIIAHLRPYHHACVGSAPNYLWAIWLPTVVFETLLFMLTIRAMFVQGQRESLTSLSLLLYRDGMLYFIAVTFCSLFSLLVWALAGSDLLGLARYFALAMVNIAGSRLVLNLKSYAAARYGDSDLTWDDPPLPPSHQISLGVPHFTPSRDVEYGTESFDIELYSIERECQQLGTRLH
ncbi:hypothetical protein L226DRAFT_530992 [Lentinus tigrinus ALCF2SS1-7]|uniref:DUF6533 domain-containing protein n=1 Tax=Lentinus tigrinus ALCF2SS1-6 TaxID=1328759 RepID=A0A5C2SNK0_9APHY|nr:hypothetical protein L227DRAFT_570748 [Lentinus tigrinus ALCF2SS1-6]RPD79166.1 hypothetical protein L226DRAFT_530992 [Lentinus tigrinus ALCF2SS1-7]